METKNRKQYELSNLLTALESINKERHQDLINELYGHTEFVLAYTVADVVNMTPESLKEAREEAESLKKA